MEMQMTSNKNTQMYLAQFNRASGAFITFMDDLDIRTLDSTYFVYVRVKVDPELQTIQGKYPKYQIVDVQDLPHRVFERVLNAACRDKIVKEYSEYTQLDRLRTVVQAVAEHLGEDIPGLAELQEMNAYIGEVKRANKALKRSYRNSDEYEFVTIEQEAIELQEQMDGGMHELVYGPRPINV